jgi:Zn-dependent peptidase ImmA (M78 family)
MTTRRRRAKDEAGLRRRARELLQELGVRPPLDIEDFGRRFGEARGRPILFRPYDIPVPGPFAVTWVDPHADIVFHPQATGQIRQNHCKAHELGHLIAEHPPELIHGVHMHRRTKYDSQEEWEAEVIASIILEWAMVFTAVTPRPGPEGGRVERAFTLHRLGWW